ncbi:SLAIN motif-containing protein 1-like isoform X5 [Sebastes umbrosus]|uniref:SLAIN motif-containing protein 1-like isoform X5 n=1 Tax=Sebastes umbrosus TaxID=72105 RepID=UPI0018A119F6|nr:SLAIN motif-containing protein 1-like isoform X5 [Sebastes umbrosus]
MLSTTSTLELQGRKRTRRRKRRIRFWMSWNFWILILCPVQMNPMRHGCTCPLKPESPQTSPSLLSSGAGRLWMVPNQRWRPPGGRCPSDWNKCPGGVAPCPARLPPPPLVLLSVEWPECRPSLLPHQPNSAPPPSLKDTAAASGAAPSAPSPPWTATSGPRSWRTTPSLWDTNCKTSLTSRLWPDCRRRISELIATSASLTRGGLRQDYASTSSIMANRRSQSFTFQLSQLSAGPDLEEEDEEDDEDYGLLPPPQPRLTRLPHSHTFSSIRDWRRSTSSLSTPPSTPSTPPYPAAGFAFQPQLQAQPQGLGLGLGLGSLCAAEPHGFRPGSAEYENKLRRSMPNLVRTPSMPSVPIPTNPSASPSLLRNSLSFDSSSGLARLQSSIPSPGQLQNRVQSVGNFSSLSRPPLKATAYVSPTIKGSASMPTSTNLQCLNISGGGNSGIPMLSKSPGGGGTPTSAPNTPRSGLPRPASFVGTPTSTPRSKVAQPARSLLTPPKSLSTLSALRDSTWRDGCY